MGYSGLFVLGKGMDGRVKCPRSSVCTIFFHTRAIQQKVPISLLTATNCFQPRLSTENAWCTFSVQCCPHCFSGPSIFLISFPTFLAFLFSPSLSRCQAITNHFPLSYYFLPHTVPMWAFVQARTWFSLEVHAWVILLLR